jgi:hypothetical protein
MNENIVEMVKSNKGHDKIVVNASGNNLLYLITN